MMQSISPIKSLRLLASPPKKFDETGNKGVVTSVHGIINNEFSNYSVAGRKRSQLQANFRNKSIQIYNKGIKTISLEMPVLGLERAVVYPKNKVSKLQLKKRILKKITHSDHQIPSSNNLEKIRESNKDMKCERKSVTFLNTEITIDDQKMIQEEMMRTKYSIKNSPRIASDTMLHKKYLNELYKNNLKLPSNDMIIKGSKLKPHQTKELSLKDVSVVPNIINNQPPIIHQSSTCGPPKCTQEGIEKRSSFESKIPKFKRFVKRLQRIKSEDGEIQTDCKTTHSKASVTINNELKNVDTIHKPKSRSKTSQVSDTETTSVQLSQTVSKCSQNSTQTNQSLASASTIKERSSKVKIDVADVKKTGEKARLYNKNNKKKPSVITPVKAKVATKPIREIKSVMNEIPISKKAYTTSNRNMKKR